jgi:hypothetical protein
MRHPDLHIRRGVARRDRHRGNQHRQQRHTRIYHAGTDNNAHNTPLFEYMFDNECSPVGVTKSPVGCYCDLIASWTYPEIDGNPTHLILQVPIVTAAMLLGEMKSNAAVEEEEFKRCSKLLEMRMSKL